MSVEREFEDIGTKKQAASFTQEHEDVSLVNDLPLEVL